MKKILLTPPRKLKVILFATILLILLLASIICVLAFWTSQRVTIKIEESGFKPEIIEITRGAEVTWVNEDKNLHWPASDFHPTHSKYQSDKKGCINSPLDACVGLKNGEEYKFKFTYTGIWGIHDHLNPGLTMKVIVKEKSFLEVLGDFANSFFGSTKEVQNEVIEKLIKTDPKKAWIELKQKYFVNGQVVGDVHQLAHKIGNEFYLRYGLKGVVLCDSTFAFGCFHGVSEKLLATEGSEVIQKVEKECEGFFSSTEKVKLTGCLHGMGHGLLSWENLNGQRALLDCDLLQDKHRSDCYDGVFMELSFNTKLISGLDIANPWKFCSSLNESYQEKCASYQPVFFQAKYGLNYEDMGEICSTSPNASNSNQCYTRLGFLISSESLGSFEKIKEVCSKYSGGGKSFCILGASEDVVFQKYADWEKVSEDLCNQLMGSDKDHCKNRVEDVKDFNEKLKE